MSKGTRKLEIVITASANKAKKAFAAVNKGIKGITSAVFSMQSAFAVAATGFGVTKLASGFIDAARATENYRIRLEVLTGSQKEANRLFDSMSKYASKVPFEFEQIMGAATALGGVLEGDVEKIEEWIPRIGNLAAATGLSIEDTTNQVSRMLSAGAASADLFRERGVLAMLGFQEGVSYSVDETRKKLVEMLDGPQSRFKGATDKMANTWDGLMSMLADAWFSFQNKVMESGVFKALKERIQGVLAEIEKLKNTGELDKIAKDFGVGIVQGIQKGFEIAQVVVKGLLKGAEVLSLAVTGWQSLIKLGQMLVLQAERTFLGFINDARQWALYLDKIIQKIPGATKTGVDWDTWDAFYETELKREKLAEQIKVKEQEMFKAALDGQKSHESFVASLNKVGTGVTDFLKNSAEQTKKIADEAKEIAPAFNEAAEAAKRYQAAAGSGGRTFGDTNLLQGLSRTEGE